MGLLSFLKNVGEKLTGHEEHPTSQAIKSEMTRLGLDTDKVEVEVDGDKVKITGNVKDQETLEKAVLAAGNVKGVASVEDNVTVAQAGTQSKFHTVESGDTLSKIAKSFYGDANKYPIIFEANKPMLKSANAIYPGQVLRIPELNEASA